MNAITQPLIEISTEKNRLDIAMIYDFLQTSYWANTRSLEQIQRSIEYTHCFGVYLGERQIGFARVLTDQVAFAYLMDVFILEPFRGNGYAKQLVKTILEYPNFADVSRWMLITADAHQLYSKVGFLPLENPAMLMEIKNK